MVTFEDAKRTDRLAAIQQMAAKDAPSHWWDDPELKVALLERAEHELQEADERLAPLKSEAAWEFQDLQELENGEPPQTSAPKPAAQPAAHRPSPKKKGR